MTRFLLVLSLIMVGLSLAGCPKKDKAVEPTPAALTEPADPKETPKPAEPAPTPAPAPAPAPAEPKK